MNDFGILAAHDQLHLGFIFNSRKCPYCGFKEQS